MGEPVGELIGAGADPDLGHAEAPDNLPVRAFDTEQVYILAVPPHNRARA